ncbi:MAG: manganese efflux pump [Spirochaetales bacterium]|jgi:manganese efflux pump family protein|nr:manganese efflux pump [Spirochaetales bacterium]
MNPIEMILVGIGLSVDAFVVSICKGLSIRGKAWKTAFVYALTFGVFQAGMPLAGYFIGSQFVTVLQRFSKWIAFACFMFLGVKTIVDTLSKPSCGCDSSSCNDGINYLELLSLAIATSIDALVVGFSFALIPNMDIYLAVSLIGGVTFLLCLPAVMLGRLLGSRTERVSSIIGGAILILLAVKVIVA